ncbi:MAG: hypothetical protein HN348_34535, partial [Proteobacteria bacterium]|nr:hypothetical protein [Pseudomonadota bacterium]
NVIEDWYSDTLDLGHRNTEYACKHLRVERNLLRDSGIVKSTGHTTDASNSVFYVNNRYLNLTTRPMDYHHGFTVRRLHETWSLPTEVSPGVPMYGHHLYDATNAQDDDHGPTIFLNNLIRWTGWTPPRVWRLDSKTVDYILDDLDADYSLHLSCVEPEDWFAIDSSPIETGTLSDWQSEYGQEINSEWLDAAEAYVEWTNEDGGNQFVGTPSVRQIELTCPTNPSLDVTFEIDRDFAGNARPPNRPGMTKGAYQEAGMDAFLAGHYCAQVAM